MVNGNNFQAFTPAPETPVESLRLELERSDRAYSFLLNSSRILSSLDSDHESTLQRLAECVAIHFNAVCDISLVSDNGELVLPLAMYHPSGDVRASVRNLFTLNRVKVGEGMVGSVISNNRELLELEAPAELREFVAQYDPLLIPESFIYCPLRSSGNRVLGALHVTRLAGHPILTEHEINQVRKLSDHTALFLENVHLREVQRKELNWRKEVQDRLEQSLRVNAFLLRTSRLLSDLSSDRQAVLDSLTAEVSRHFDVFCVIYMMSADGIGLRPRAAHHDRPDVLSALQAAFDGNGMEDGMRVARYVTRTGEPFIVQDAGTKGMSPQKIDPLLNLSAYGFWPLRSTEPIGAMCLCKLAGQQPFRDDELTGVMQLSSHLSLFLENMLMHDRQQLEIEARTAAERKLSGKEAELRHILDAIPINISRISRDLRYRFLNASYGRMGFNPSEMVGKHIREVLGEKGLMQVMPRIERVLAGHMLNYDETVTMADGFTRHFSVVVAPDKDHRGRVVGFYSCTIDITEKVEFQRSLQLSEERYRSLLLNSGDAFCLHDVHGQIIDINDCASDMTGYDRGELLSMNSNQLDSGLSREEYVKRLIRLESDVPVTHDTFITHKNGHQIPVEIRLVKRVEDGREFIQSLVRDRTHKYEQELLLRKSEESLRVLVDNVDDVIMTVNYSGTILTINRTKQGTKPQDVIGTSIFDTLHGEVADRVRQDLITARKTGAPFEVLARYKGPDKTVEWYQTMYCPVNGADTLVGVSRNITHIKESELHLMNGITQGQEQERKRLGADLHDGVGQLLSSIALELSQLRQSEVSADELRMNLSGLSMRVTNAIDEIRNISHDLMPGLLESFGLVEAIKGVCRTMQARTGLLFHFDAIDIEPLYQPEVEINIYRIAQELINNTVRHAHCTRVFTSLIDHGDLLTLSVEDDGVGFDSYNQHEGIGLSNIRSRVSILGGNLSVESSSTSGTLVHIEIPKTR